MGCWNGTCGISQLPIKAGDPILAFIICQHSYPDEGNHSGYCYTNGMYQPLTLPILCRYNDYGGIENIENTYILDLIRQQFNLNQNQNVEEWINDVIERDNGTVEYHGILGDKQQILNLGLWMVHRSIVEDFKDIADPDAWWNEKGLTPRDIVSQDFRHILDYLKDNKTEVLDAIEGHKRYAKKVGELVSNYLAYLYELDPRSTKAKKTTGTDNYFLYTLGFGGGYAGTGFVTKDFFKTYRGYFLDTFWAQGDLTALYDDVLTFYTLSSMMNSLRVGFIPQSGKGSQSDEYNAYIALMKSMTNIIKQEEAGRIGFGLKYDEEEDRFKGYQW